jgi:hypothetical protein
LSRVCQWLRSAAWGWGKRELRGLARGHRPEWGKGKLAGWGAGQVLRVMAPAIDPAIGIAGPGSTGAVLRGWCREVRSWPRAACLLPGR